MKKLLILVMLCIFSHAVHAEFEEVNNVASQEDVYNACQAYKEDFTKSILCKRAGQRKLIERQEALDEKKRQEAREQQQRMFADELKRREEAADRAIAKTPSDPANGQNDMESRQIKDRDMPVRRQVSNTPALEPGSELQQRQAMVEEKERAAAQMQAEQRAKEQAEQAERRAKEQETAAAQREAQQAQALDTQRKQEAKDKLYGILLLGLAIAVVVLFIGAGAKKFVVFYDRGDIMAVAMIFISVAAGYLLSAITGSLFSSNIIDMIFIVCGYIMAAIFSVITVRQSIEHNRSVAVGLFVGCMKIITSVLLIAIMLLGLNGMVNQRKVNSLEDVRQNRRNRVAGAVLFALGSWLGSLLLNGKEIYEERGWAPPA